MRYSPLTFAALIPASLLLTAVSEASPKTLLEAVQAVVAPGEVGDPRDRRVTVTQDATSLHKVSELSTTIRAVSGNTVSLTSTWSVVIKQVRPCKFDVDDELRSKSSIGVSFHDVYSVDFTRARFDDVQVVAGIINRFGNRVGAILIPEAKFCAVAGNPFMNAGIKPGSCTDGLFVGPIQEPADVDLFMPAINQIKEACKAISLERTRRVHLGGRELTDERRRQMRRPFPSRWGCRPARSGGTLARPAIAENFMFMAAAARTRSVPVVARLLLHRAY